MSRRKRHTPEQIVAKLGEADALLNAGQSLAHVIQHLGVSEATFHRWRNQYGGMKAEEAKRLKHQAAVRVGLQQLPEEVGELGRVLLRVHQIMALSGGPVQGPVDAAFLVGPGGRHPRTDPLEGPDLGQGRVEMNLTFVEVQQVERGLGFEGAFFKKSSRAFFSS